MVSQAIPAIRYTRLPSMLCRNVRRISDVAINSISNKTPANARYVSARLCQNKIPLPTNAEIANKISSIII